MISHRPRGLPGSGLPEYLSSVTSGVPFWARTCGYLVVVVGVLEVLCRLFIGVAPPERYDARYDKISEPGRWVVHSTEGFSRGRTNELGFLDAAVPRPPPADGILVVGDSFTEARHVDQAARFTNRLEKRLARRVYNAGHAGWSPLNAIGFLAAEKATLAPSTVIVQVSGNDLQDIVSRKRPHVVEPAPGAFAVELPKRAAEGTAARVKAILFRSALVAAATSSALQLLAGGRDNDATGSCAAPDPRAVRALPWIAGELRRGHDDVHLLYLPMLDYHAGCVDRCAAARDLFARAAAGAGLAFVDATPALCERFRATGQPPNGFANTVPGTGHLNAAGHAVVAGVLADHLVAHRRLAR